MPKIGKWYPLAERLSRWARVRLLKLILEEYTQTEVANVCGVSRQAVSNWITKEDYHPNDGNASTLLKLAWTIDKKRVGKILQDDARRYLSELEKIGAAI